MMTSERDPLNTAEFKPEFKTEFKVRTDMRTRDLIDQAIASLPTIGLKRAAAFLESMNVPPEVAVRALVYPDRRRMR